MRYISVCALAGLLLSTLSGVSTAGDNEWTSIGPPGEEMHAIAVDLTDNQVLYAGATSGFWRTTDGGESWEFLPFGYAFREFVVDPDLETVWGIWGEGSWSDGVWYSTDRGDNWNMSLFLYMGDALDICSENPQALWTASREDWTGSSWGIWRTKDHGLTWQGGWLTDWSFRAIAAHPEDWQTAYAGCEEGKIFKTTTGGDEWEECFDEEIPVLSLAIDSFRPQTLYTAIGCGTYSDGVYKTTNGGGSWNFLLLLGFADALAIEGRNPEVVYAASTHNGVMRSLNSGRDWMEINEKLENLNVHYLAVDPSDRRTVYAATWGDGIYRYHWVPTVSIAMEPDTNQVPPGGTLGYTVVLTNNTDQMQTFRAGSILYLPDGSKKVYIYPKPVSLRPGEVRTVHPSLTAPDIVGEYRYVIQIGTSPRDIWDVESFRFYVKP
jgi:hypothetical protein